MKKQDSIINRDQFLELIFRQIDMIDDFEALQEIMDKVSNKLQIIGNSIPSARKVPSQSRQSQKDELKRLEHFRKADRENEQVLSREDSIVADYDLWEGDELEKRSSNRRSPSINKTVEKPTFQFKSFEWIYQDKFSKYVLQLNQIPFDLKSNLFETNQNQSQGSKLVQGSQIHVLIERFLNDPKKNEKILIENEHLTPEQGQWVEFLVQTVKSYCKDYLNLNEMKTEKHISNYLPKINLASIQNKSTSISQNVSQNINVTQSLSSSVEVNQNSIGGGPISHSQTSVQGHQKKVDVIFYNETRAVIIDWKFSPFSITDQVYMNEGNHFIDQIQEVKKFFNFQKEVTLMIVPLKKVSGCQLIELNSEDIEKLQKEQINQEIFYQTKYKKMRNQILSKQFNINQKCLIGEGKKQNLNIREYLTNIIDQKKKSQQDYYGNYKNCYGKNPPNNKEQFWAFHVLLKEMNKNNEQILQQVYSQPPVIQQKKIKGSSKDEVDFFTMNENNPLMLKKQNSMPRHKYRQNKSVLQFVLDQIPADYFFDDEYEDEYSDYEEDEDQAFEIVIQEKDEDDEDFEENIPVENQEEQENVMPEDF